MLFHRRHCAAYVCLGFVALRHNHSDLLVCSPLLSCVVDGKIYVIGGNEGKSNAEVMGRIVGGGVKTIEYFDPSPSVFSSPKFEVVGDTVMGWRHHFAAAASEDTANPPPAATLQGTVNSCSLQ